MVTHSNIDAKSMVIITIGIENIIFPMIPEMNSSGKKATIVVSKDVVILGITSEMPSTEALNQSLPMS